MRNDGPQGRDTIALLGRRKHNFRKGCGMLGQRGPGLFQHLLALVGFDLVCLGQHALKRHGAGVQQLHDFVIDRFYTVA